MEKGKLKERINFERQVVTTDLYGHEKYSYENAFSTRAEIHYNNGNRLIENSEIFYDNSLTFKVQSYCPVEDTMRIKYNDKYYRIISVNDEKNHLRQKIIIAELINE